MGKAGKISIALVILAIAAAVVVAMLALKNLDGFIKQVIEEEGSKALHTGLTLNEVKFTPQEGRAELHGLTIANPPGYTTDYAFRMQQVAVEVDPGSVTGDVIVIREILVDGAVILAEQQGLNTNLRDLLDKMTPAEPAQETPPESGPLANVRLMVEKFSFINSKATVVTQQFGDKSMDMPDIFMSNIGDKTTGLTPNELANRMSGILLKRAEKAVKAELGNLAKDAARNELEKQIKKKLGDKASLDGLKSLFDK